MEHNENHTATPAQTAPALPDHGTSYYKGFWGSYKGHTRGYLRGLLVGALAGVLVGAGLALVGPVLGIFSLGLGTAAALMATFTAVGSIVGLELMGKIGNTAGNAASQYAQEELKLRYPALPEISAGSPAPGIGHHFEVPPDIGADKIFNWRVAVPGVLVGTGLGALLAFGVPHAAAELLGATGLDLFTAMGGSAVTAATVGAGGLMGASFGVNRGLFKTLFNYTDSAFNEGSLTGPTPEQIARDQARYKVQDPENPYPITGAQLHDEYQRLLNGYYKKSFTAGWSGDRRGLLGGAIAGSLTGLAGGALACIGIALAVGTGGIAPLAMAITVGLCTALGAKQGMHIFSDAGRESAAYSVVKEIHNERIKALENGPDISFDEAEKRACQRMTHHPDMNPPGTEHKTWFNWKIGAIGIAVGSAVGVALSPIMGPLVAHLLPHAAEGVVEAATTAPEIWAGITHAIPATATTFGFAGASFGMGDKTMEKLYSVADKIFMGIFFPGHSAKDHVSHDYPAIGPDSKLKGHAPEPQKAPVVEVSHKHDTHEHIPQAAPAFMKKILEREPASAQTSHAPAARPALKASSFMARHASKTQPSADLATMRS